MAHRREEDVPTFEELYREAAIIRKKREVQAKEQEEKRTHQELEQATFRPVTNFSKNRQISQVNKDLQVLKDYTSKEYV